MKNQSKAAFPRRRRRQGLLPLLACVPLLALSVVLGWLVALPPGQAGRGGAGRIAHQRKGKMRLKLAVLLYVQCRSRDNSRVRSFS
jgi:hypothetical protein